eukprot:TRINITY_DN2964_c0_g1_i2.p4 TRINITY_DN2964_c0_g1~~TRINITY_DN2964_c0_g1_i2.p4  ORF type:complete len:150 (+),score=7.88 TRINITY_DN2964_c0_g1_i2:1318-1767(+)
MIRSTCRLFRSANETGQQQQHLTLTAEAVASITLIEWAVHNCLQPQLAQAVCIRSGNLDGLRRLCSLLDLQLDEIHCSLAASRGHLEVLKWLRVNGSAWDDSACEAAVFTGKLSVLKWLRANGCPWETRKTCIAAAMCGSPRAVAVGTQ